MIAGQATSSLSNLATSIAIAATLSLHEYGLWGILYGVIAIATNGLRSGVYESFLTQQSSHALPPLGAPLLMAAVILAGGIGSFLLVGGAVGVIVCSFAVMPLQDCFRYHSLIIDGGRAALTCDFTRLVISGGGLLAAAMGSTSVAIGFIAVAPLASLILIVSTQRQKRAEWRWFEVGRVAWRFAAEGQMASIAGAIALVSLAFWQSTEAVGVLRILVLIFQPLFALQLAMRVLFLRAGDDARARTIQRLGVGAIGCYAGVAVLIWLVLRASDSAIGSELTVSIFVVGLIAELLRAVAQLQSDSGRRLGRSSELLQSRAASSFALVALTNALAPSFAVVGVLAARLVSQLLALLLYAQARMTAKSKLRRSHAGGEEGTP